MRNRLFYSILLLLYSFTCYAQYSKQEKCDTIFLRGGKKLIGRVTQIEEFIHYKEPSDTAVFHRVGAWRVTHIKTAKGEDILFPRPERYSSTLRHHPVPSLQDSDKIMLKEGKVLSGKIIKVDDYIHYTTANDKKNGYKVAIWKVDYVKYSSGKIFKPKEAPEVIR